MRDTSFERDSEIPVKRDIAKIVARLSEIRGDLTAAERYAFDAVASALRKGRKVAAADIARLEMFLARHGRK